jgi:hypothetical protein
MDVLVLQAEVTQAGEAALALADAHFTVVLAVETSAQEAAAAWDSAAIHIKDAKDRATLAEREARERVSRVEAAKAVSLAYAHEDAKGLVQKITHLEGELAEACQARVVAEENSYGLSDTAVNAKHQWERTKRERREHCEELTLLQTWGSKLCLDCGPPRLRNPLPEGMWIPALRHTEMAGELIALWAAVSSIVELVLKRSPDKTFRVLVVSELVAEFQRLELQHSWLELSDVRIYDLLIGPPLGLAQLANRLDEAAEQLGAKLAARQVADAELEALRPLAAWARDLMLENADGPSSLATSLSCGISPSEHHRSPLFSAGMWSSPQLCIQVAPLVRTSTTFSSSSLSLSELSRRPLKPRSGHATPWS